MYPSKTKTLRPSSESGCHASFSAGESSSGGSRSTAHVSLHPSLSHATDDEYGDDGDGDVFVSMTSCRSKTQGLSICSEPRRFDERKKTPRASMRSILGSPLKYNDENNIDGDDAFVSTTSSRRPSMSGLQRFSDRILRETSGATNKFRSRSRSREPMSRSNLKSTSQTLGCEGGVLRFSTVGVLDILEDDIHTLKLLRSQTMEVVKNERSNELVTQRVDAPDRSKLSMQGGNGDLSFSNSPKTRSVDQAFQDADPVSMTARILPSAGRGNGNGEDYVKNSESLIRVKVLERENAMLQELVRKIKAESAKIIEQVKEDSVMIAEHNQMKLIEVSTIRLQLDRSKYKEAELERTLHEVTSNAKRQCGRMLDELSTCQAENGKLSEKFKALEQENELLKETSKRKGPAAEQAVCEAVNEAKSERKATPEELSASRVENSDITGNSTKMRNLDQKSAKNTEDYERKMSEFSGVNLQLEEFKRKEAELLQAPRKVMSDGESKQAVISDELLTSQTGNDQLLNRFGALQRENEQLQESMCSIKQDSINMVEYNRKELIKFCSSYVKSQLDGSKIKNAELEKALRDVISAIESKHGSLSKELMLAYKLHHSEVKMLEERLKATTEENAGKTLQLEKSKVKETKLDQALREVGSKVEMLSRKLSTVNEKHHCKKKLWEERLIGASKEIAEKTNIIHKLESDIERLDRSVTGDKEQAEKLMYENIKRTEKGLKSKESCLLEKVRSLEMQLEGFRLGYLELEKKTRNISAKLSCAERLNDKLQKGVDQSKEQKDDCTMAIEVSLRREDENLDTGAPQNHIIDESLAETIIESRGPSDTE